MKFINKFNQEKQDDCKKRQISKDCLHLKPNKYIDLTYSEFLLKHTTFKQDQEEDNALTNARFLSDR